ncbi:MAG: hypothetical protein CMJ34_13415 [Phycisphaerae bacterium]|nr:hypothetical protein [Phycisphaerae bacterium]
MPSDQPNHDPERIPAIRVRWLQPVYQFFLPTNLSSDPKSQRTAVLLVTMILASIMFSAAFSISQAWSGLLVLSALSLSTSLGLGGLLLWLRTGGPLVQVTHALLCIAFISQAAGVVSSDGIHSFLVPSMALYPLCALVLVGKRSGLAWAAITLMFVMGLHIIEVLGLQHPSGFDTRSMPGQILGNMFVLVLYGFGLMRWQHETNQLQKAALEEATRKADAASLAKSRFLANMSHELRTPMHSIIGLTECTLNRSQTDETDAEALSIVLRSSRTMVRLLDDLLDMSRAEAGMVLLERVPFQPAVIVREVLELFSEAARRQAVSLRAEVEPELGWGMGDPSRLRQVLVNLVGNAVKFTADGSVVVRMHRVGDSVACEVEDNGPGISGELRTQIFEPFVQGDASTTREHGGSGLGLAISRHLVECMGGTLDVISTAGQGSCFRFDVCIPACHGPDAEMSEGQARAGRLRPLSVLVAEDNALNRVVLERQLESLEVDVRMVANGVEALKQLESTRFDVVLMDLHMPRLDGLNTTRRARAAGYDGPILAMTASALPEDREAAIEAGMNGFLVKPVATAVLEKALLG